MKRLISFFRDISFIMISCVGGLCLSLTGLSISWMIGTLMMAGILSFWKPLSFTIHSEKWEIHRYWMNIGQLILAIELGQKINMTVLTVFSNHWLTIMAMLLLSMIFSILSGLILWKFSQIDMLTSFFGTVPGGLSVIPSIAEEVGGNIGVVSIIQTMRVFLVIFSVPLIVSLLAVNQEQMSGSPVLDFETGQLIWTVVLTFAAWTGCQLGKYLKFPAPWLVGGMLGVACTQAIGSYLTGSNVAAWWPKFLIIAAQVLIASSIGSKFHKNMFMGLKKTIMVALFSTIGLILSMFICAYIVSNLTGITFVTAVLAFAPGGITEMATTAAVLHEDSTFVVVVQVLRVVLVCIVLPPFIKLLHQWKELKGNHSHTTRNS
jgi:hypothetical protein